MSERTGAPGRTDKERRLSRLDDPDVRRKVREIQEQIKRGKANGPGIDVEDLPEFLREQRG